MMKYFNSLYWILVILVNLTVNAYSQDIIIKNDKTEIRSKVTEITDMHIKYKKWENIDGPVYNLLKSEVFMILYANGEREIIDNSLKVSLPEKPDKEKTAGKKQDDEAPQKSDLAQNDSPPDLQKEKVKYAPYRANIGLHSPFEFGGDGEWRIIKNFLNLGTTYLYGTSNDEYIIETSFGFVYLSTYLPLNRLIRDYTNQDKGLFFFGHWGVAFDGAKYFNDRKTKILNYSSDFYFNYRLGADYYFSKGFGVSVSTHRFNTFYLGLATKF